MTIMSRPIIRELLLLTLILFFSASFHGYFNSELQNIRSEEQEANSSALIGTWVHEYWTYTFETTHTGTTIQHSTGETFPLSYRFDESTSLLELHLPKEFELDGYRVFKIRFVSDDWIEMGHKSTTWPSDPIPIMCLQRQKH